MRDLYEVLEVPRKATAAEIKASYRKMALQHHPDKGGDQEKFKEITKAYEVLGDESRRKMYDMTGSIEEDGGGPNFAEGGAGPGGMPFPFPFDLGSMFGGFFGGGGPGGPGGPRPRRRGGKAPPKVHETPISLHDFYHGKTIKMQYERRKFCEACKGEGATEWEPCKGCGGSGGVQRIMMMGPGIQTIMRGPCEACKGSGRSVKEECGSCKGTTFVTQQRQVDVVIEPGMHPGNVIVFPRECSDQPEYEEAGDLHILLVEAHTEGPQPFFRIPQAQAVNDLGTEVVVSLVDALVGCERKKEGHPGHPQGLVLEIPAGAQNGDVLRVTGEGLPIRGGGGGGGGSANASPKRGDLHVRVRVNPSPAEKAVLAREDVREKLMALFT